MSEQELVRWITGEDRLEVDADQILFELGFASGPAARRSWLRLTENPDHRRSLAAFAPQLVAALSSAGSPDRALASFERFVNSAPDPGAMLQFLAGNPRLVETLIRLFSGSQFLGEILLRNPEYFEHFTDLRRMALRKSREMFQSEARLVVAPFDTAADKLDALRRYQRWELLRIGTCDLLDLFDLPAATLQLSNLADSLVQACLEIVAAQSGISTRGFAVIGMGKLGGQELNYSSDIDFLFLSTAPSPQSTRLGERLVDALARVTTEGFLYRVDMRLRPWGKVGPLVSSPDGYISYLSKHALQWEKQALLKARVVAGDGVVGSEFLERAHPLLFCLPVENVRADVFAMKQRTEAFLLQKGRNRGDVKLGEGSIRDVEFVVQFLQLAHGQQKPEILHHNTLQSIALCSAAGLLSVSDRRVLTDGYVFLRTIEHHLQIMDYRQTHTLPDDPEAVLSLARRLGYENQRPARGRSAADQFLARYHQHSEAIRSVYLRYVGSVAMKLPDPASSSANGSSQPAPSEGSNTPSEANGPSGPLTNTSPSGMDNQLVNHHRARMSPSYADRFQDTEIAHHAALAQKLSMDRLVVVDAHPYAPTASIAPDAWEVTIVAYDYPGELSLICGLLFVYGLDIVQGDVFTYETNEPSASPTQSRQNPPRMLRQRTRLGKPASGADSRRKIVDVFTVRPVSGSRISSEMWASYTQDLEELLRMVSLGQRREARGALARRVGTRLFAGQKRGEDPISSLYPIEIEIDNESSDQTTILRIDTPDIVGFLYEFTNALAINRVYIQQVRIDTVGDRVSDTLYVTDENGEKITDPERLRELRSATVLIKHFTHLLPHSPNPESALLHFREFLVQLFNRPNWPDELASLERPEVLQAMARLLGVSDFLWDDFLRMQYTNLYPVVTDVDTLSQAKTRKQLQVELEAVLAEVHPGPKPFSDESPWVEALNAFKDREMFRIDMRHILGHNREFWDFAAELTDLTEVIINAAFHLCHEDLRVVYGTPLLENGEISEMSVCALGKCGGREMGFASDIELMFIYAGNGKTSGPQVITTAEFFEKLVTSFVRAIRARREGIFEIDLQLRPYGKTGSLSVSLDAFRRYYTPDGPAWAYERQALVKLRPIAGDYRLGRRISELRDTYVYTEEPFDVTAMRAMRERQIRHLVTGGTFNLKYSPGGLVDVEYLVQALQITHGRIHPEVRQANTREAMAAFMRNSLISKEDYTRLRKAHTFLRWLIDSMRVVRGNARDVTMPPEGSEEYAFLTRRMRYGSDTARMRDELLRYTADVQELNARLLQ